MTLQHFPNPGAAVRNKGRVLARGGSYIAVEPDNTATQVYFEHIGGRDRCVSAPVRGAAARPPSGGHRDWLSSGGAREAGKLEVVEFRACSVGQRR